MPSFPSALSIFCVIFHNRRLYHPDLVKIRQPAGSDRFNARTSTDHDARHVLVSKNDSREPLTVTMAGVKLGDRLLAVGITDVPLIAALAMKAGLTGRAAAVDADEARCAQGGAAIEREGALVEIAHAPWNAFPYDADSFDVALVRDLLPTLDAATRGRSVSRKCCACCARAAASSSFEAAARARLGAARRPPRPGRSRLRGRRAAAPTAVTRSASGYAGVRVLRRARRRCASSKAPSARDSARAGQVAPAVDRDRSRP